jgi:isoquinoline 1-oxidoreductase beta subunit
VFQANLDNNKYDRQVTGGSGAMPHSWERLRNAGATARHLLLTAAANQLDVPLSELTADKGEVFHNGKKKFTYGELVEDASKLTAPDEVALKDPKDFKIIGTPVKNVKGKEIYTGQPLFGLDVYREGMVNAMISRPPFGMKIKSVDDSAALAVAGVTDVVVFKIHLATDESQNQT